VVNSILGTVVQGRGVQEGQRIVIAGQEKVGKTTLACQAPGSLLVPCEIGYGFIQTARTDMLTTWEQVEQLCLELIAGAKAGRIKPGQSIVWDSATAIERMIHDYILRTDPTYKPGNKTALTMESALGGYGKAYNNALELFTKWSRYMDELAKYGRINIITTCHVFAATVVDPAHGEYQTWDLQLHSPKNQKTYGKREFITQWADAVFFLHEPLLVLKAEKGQTLTRGVSGNQGRMLALDRTPGWVAGNRFGLSGLIPIPEQQGWNYLANAIYQRTGIDLYNRSLS
jgi:hypothetical protein